MISSDLVTKIGLYGLLPLFVGVLVFIMVDVAKESDAGKRGTFWIFLALGAGFATFGIKLLVELGFQRGWF